MRWHNHCYSPLITPVNCKVWLFKEDTHWPSRSTSTILRLITMIPKQGQKKVIFITPFQGKFSCLFCARVKWGFSKHNTCKTQSFGNIFRYTSSTRLWEVHCLQSNIVKMQPRQSCIRLIKLRSSWVHSDNLREKKEKRDLNTTRLHMLITFCGGYFGVWKAMGCKPHKCVLVFITLPVVVFGPDWISYTQ